MSVQRKIIIQKREKSNRKKQRCPTCHKRRSKKFHVCSNMTKEAKRLRKLEAQDG